MPTSSGGFPSALHTRGTPSPAVGQHVNLCISMIEMAYLLESGLALDDTCRIVPMVPHSIPALAWATQQITACIRGHFLTVQATMYIWTWSLDGLADPAAQPSQRLCSLAPLAHVDMRAAPFPGGTKRLIRSTAHPMPFRLSRIMISTMLCNHR